MNIARASALEEMASGIAHELNQPLGAIATFSQAGARMLSRPMPMINEARGVLNQITEAALSAGDGIRRIRRLFDRADAPETLCDVAELIAELHPILELLSVRAGFKLAVIAPPGLPRVRVDKIRIQHVLFTLVQNALEAGGTAVRTELEDEDSVPPQVLIEMDSDRYWVRTAVTDYGDGIPAAARDNIFRPFFTTKPNGTGLGLASSRAIIEAHDGTIGFDTLESGGTCFWFKLPQPTHKNRSDNES